ncbi:hypothetical protein LXL04_018267 [Taraxacum kok-saghyz]
MMPNLLSPKPQTTTYEEDWWTKKERGDGIEGRVCRNPEPTPDHLYNISHIPLLESSSPLLLTIVQIFLASCITFTESTYKMASFDKKLAMAKSCSHEGVVAGAKAAALATIATAIPTMASARMVPWARTHLNHTAQALIISTKSSSPLLLTIVQIFLASCITFTESTYKMASFDKKLAMTKSCSHEGVVAGAKAAALATIATAIPTMASARMVPWARTHLNHTAQALIISTMAGAAFFIVADKTILKIARRNSFEDAQP